MMKTMSAAMMMSHGASAPYANVASCCAHTASMQFAKIALILDAIIMASIIICGLVIRLSILGVALVLLVVLLICGKVNMPKMRMFV